MLFLYEPRLKIFIHTSLHLKKSPVGDRLRPLVLALSRERIMMDTQPAGKNPPAQSLHNQVAIITGASQGIGQATALRLAQFGVNLMLCARNTVKLNALIEQIKTVAPSIRCIARPCDVQDALQVNSVVSDTIETFGRVDILINNAGVAPRVGLFQEMSIEDIDRTIDTNLKGCMYFMRAVIPHMVHQQGGIIINMNSVAGKTAYPYWSVYDASKFGLHALTEAVAEEQRSNNIKVIGIYPGAVDTPIWEGLDLEKDPHRDGMLEAEHVAEAILYTLNQPQKVFIKEVVLGPLKPSL
jgi:NADP-dependent 3-hydroxy acid dehydrogenase YdfG